MEVLDRFLRYVSIYSTSDEESGTVPSASRELDMTKLLEAELKAIGLADVYADEHAYVYGRLPASAGCEKAAKIGLIAHIDTAPDFSGENIRPQILHHYDGGDVRLGSSGRTLSAADYPHLQSLAGQTLITTDGTTLLGADDKAGITAIVSACERILKEKLPHGEVEICFTPDEEIGHGAGLLDLQRFGADFAFTVDGDELDTVNYETFNAAAAEWQITGVSVHPGSGKGHMKNAALIAMEINAMLPAGQIPALTENYEGFFHLTGMSGDVSSAKLSYIIRDHDAASFAARQETMRHIEKIINEKYGEGTAVLTIREQYRNMAEILQKDMKPVELAERALRACGLKPRRVPVRGGTDGAELSFRGLPCPNLGTGGWCYHGPYEHITAEALETCTEILLALIEENIK